MLVFPKVLIFRLLVLVLKLVGDEEVGQPIEREVLELKDELLVLNDEVLELKGEVLALLSQQLELELFSQYEEQERQLFQQLELELLFR